MPLQQALVVSLNTNAIRAEEDLAEARAGCAQLQAKLQAALVASRDAALDKAQMKLAAERAELEAAEREAKAERAAAEEACAKVAALEVSDTGRGKRLCNPLVTCSTAETSPFRTPFASQPCMQPGTHSGAQSWSG